MTRLIKERSEITSHFEFLEYQNHLDDEIVNEVSNEVALAINITEEEKEIVQNIEVTISQSDNYLQCHEENYYYITIEVEYCHMQHMDGVEFKEILNYQKHLDDEITFNITKEENGLIQNIEANENLNHQKHSNNTVVNEDVENVHSIEVTTSQSNNYLQCYEENYYITIDEEVEYCHMQHMDGVELKEILNYQKYLDDEITLDIIKEENVSNNSVINEDVEDLANILTENLEDNSLIKEFENELYLDDFEFPEEIPITEEPTITSSEKDEPPPPYEEFVSSVNIVQNLTVDYIIQHNVTIKNNNEEESSFLTLVKKVAKEVENIYVKAVEGHKAAINNIEKFDIEGKKATNNVENLSNFSEK